MPLLNRVDIFMLFLPADKQAFYFAGQRLSKH
ncbi:hypothetical protein BN440_1693 [Erwinia amylovora MR1]|nr:hypothetical protein BN440_1693 [Erwinia amylovora MR1]